MEANPRPASNSSCKKAKTWLIGGEKMGVSSLRQNSHHRFRLDEYVFNVDCCVAAKKTGQADVGIFWCRSASSTHVRPPGKADAAFGVGWKKK